MLGVPGGGDRRQPENQNTSDSGPLGAFTAGHPGSSWRDRIVAAPRAWTSTMSDWFRCTFDSRRTITKDYLHRSGPHGPRGAGPHVRERSWRWFVRPGFHAT